MCQTASDAVLREDADYFAGALANGKAGLPPNHRNVVRFTNRARSLYAVIVDGAGASKSTTQWREHFFPMLKARWLRPGKRVQPSTAANQASAIVVNASSLIASPSGTPLAAPNV